MGSQSWFHRLGAVCYRRRRLVIALWLLALCLAAQPLTQLHRRLSQGGFEVPGSQSAQVKHALDTDFPHAFERSAVLVLHADRLAADQAPFRATVARVRAAVAKAPGVAAVSNPYRVPAQAVSADGHTAIVTLGLRDSQDEALRHAPAVEAAAQAATRGTPIIAQVSGDSAYYAAFQATTTRDLEQAERIALPISLAILALAFGSLVAAGVPLVLAMLALGVSFGLISLLAASTGVSVFTQNLASMIGIGVGIDYCLFILTRYRQRLAEGRPVADAVAEAMATSGNAVLVSALTVVVALSGTQLVAVAAFRSMGLGAIIAVAVAGTAALTLLPALLGVVGTRVDALRLGRPRAGQAGGTALWHRWATAVMRHPWPALVASVLILGVLAIPARELRLGTSGPSILPASSGPRLASETLARAFGAGESGPIQVVMTDRRGIRGAGLARVEAFVRQVGADPETRRVGRSLVSRDGTSMLLSVVTRHGPQSHEAEALVHRLRAELAGTRAAVGGEPGLNADINAEVGRRLPAVVALVLSLSFLVLLVFFRSLLLPLKAIAMNLASVLATCGVLVVTFQQGHGQRLLGFVAPGHIEAFLPLFLFCTLFGLSMDYEVFLLARVREEYVQGGDSTEAVGWGLEHTAGIITSAAAIMVTVFGAFAFTRLVPIKATGLGLAVAVAIDATLVRLVLVPATMRLLGRWNWWLPGWLDRLLAAGWVRAGRSRRLAPRHARQGRRPPPRHLASRGRKPVSAPPVRPPLVGSTRRSEGAE